MSRVLAIHAHPDDLELLAGGTLALLARAGCEVVMVTATAGEGGSAEHEPDATAALRKAEAAASAARIGATYRCLGFPDLGVFNDDASRRAVTEMIRAERPDVVITSSPEDYHPDHEAISTLVRDACFAAPVAGYRTGPAAALTTIPALYFVDAVDPPAIGPCRVLDLSARATPPRPGRRTDLRRGTTLPPCPSSKQSARPQAAQQGSIRRSPVEID